LHRPLGFSYQDRIAVGVGIDGVRRPLPADASDWDAIREAIATIPGVKSVGPYQLRRDMPVSLDGQPVAKAKGYAVTAGYFESWQVQLVEGRFFTADELRSDAPVAIVDATLAHRLWPESSALGRDIDV